MSKWKEPLKKTYCKELVEAFKEYDPSEPNSNAGKLDGLEQTFYKIKNSTCKPLTCRRNCKGNPLCLSGLGEAYWLTDSVESPDQETEDPTEERRKPGSHVGLRNLGATCYVNSLLQLWFHNPKFRRAVYDWNPLEDDVEQGNSTVHDYEIYNPISEIGHLQVLFALMSCTERSYLDPTEFVESLGLDTSTQQDAQEFSKLYISLLEGRFKQQSLPHVQNMISDNFQGEYSYLTRCSKCNTESVSPSKFYELELNIMGHKTLDESLSEFLVEEKLEGADKYSCAVCCDKQEAVRFIELKTLPPTLNLQLMRFVYDRQKGYKKKINSNLQFPEVLNMGKYMKSKNDNDEELNYNLTAVLLHRGCSANSGHYIAYIKDSCGTWYVFNDQVVQKSEGKGLKLKFEESDDGTKPNSQRAPKGFFSSSKAYMLVYTKSNGNQPVIKKEQLNCKPDLCERLEVYIRRQNDKFKNWIEEETSVRKCCLASKNVLKQKMASLIQALPAGGDTWASVEVIPIDWIKQWLRNATEKVEPIDNSAFVCSHNKLNPDCVGSVKYVHSETGSVLFEKYSGGPRLIGDQIPCRECIINKCKLFHSENKIKDHYNEIQTLLKIKMEENTPGFWVDKESLKRWRQYIRLNSDFPYCNEGYNTDGNEVSSSDLNSCIKEDREDEMDLSTRLAVLNNSRRSRENISSKNESESYSMSKINGSSKDSNSVNCIGKEGFNGFSNSLATSKENNLSEAQSSIVQKNEMTNHHLFKNLAPTIPPNSVESVLNRFEDTLGNIMSLHHPLVQFIKSVSSDQEVLENCKELESKSNLLSLQFKEVKSRFNDYHHNKQSSGWKEIYLNNCKRSRKSGEFPKVHSLGSSASQPDLRNRKEYNFINNRSDSNNSNSLHGDNVECSSEGENFSQNVCNSKDSRSAASSESCDEDSENDRINTCNVTRNNCEEYSAAVNRESECSEVNTKHHSERRQFVTNRVNDCETHIPSTDSENNCVKHEDDLEKYEEFNEAVACVHGNLKIEESTRRLVPVKVWEILKQYFPLSVTFPNDAEPCRECLKLANENEQSKDVYRKQAATEKELLKDLFLGKNRPDLDKCHEMTTFYIVPNEEFIMPWRQFIRRAGKVDPVTSLNTHLFICEHGGFQFCVERDAEKYVLLTENEWAALNSIYKGSQPVSISTIGDGATLTEPAECESCKKDRFEAEKLAMLDYENAVIYVQKVNEEVLPTTSEYDEDLSEPKNKKVKLSSAPKSQFRRTSRRTRRKVRSETSIKVASTITLKDFKIKVMKQFDVIPSDQHLFDEDGRELTDNDLTLAELKLFPNSTVYLKVDEPTVSVDDSDSFSEEFSKNRTPEAGFKGTKLIS